MCPFHTGKLPMLKSLGYQLSKIADGHYTVLSGKTWAEMNDGRWTLHDWEATPERPGQGAPPRPCWMERPPNISSEALLDETADCTPSPTAFFFGPSFAGKG